MSFLTLPPEINSLRMFSGAGSAPMIAAAAAWDGLAAELNSAAESFSSVTSGLAGQAWQGPAAAAMVSAAAPYAGWLNAAATQASGAAAQAKAVVSAFESAFAATVHPAAVAANRSNFVELVVSNLFGQNAPAIAAAESNYEQMWAADVAAMVGYHGGVSAAAEQLTSLPAALQNLPGQLAGAATSNPVNGFLQQLETAQVNFNTNLVNGEMTFNKSLVNSELGFEQAVFGTNTALNGFVNRSFNVGNLLWGSAQQGVNLFTGAQVPTTFNSNLLIGSAAQPFNSGTIGGPLGAFDQSLAAGADLAGLFPGQINVSLGAPAQAALSAVGSAATTNPINTFFQQLDTAQTNFNANLINSELTFNHALTNAEVTWEQSTFGTDSALNGFVNRSFNVGNLLWGSGQQFINGFTGAQPGTGFNSSLLLGSGQQVFNGGQIGGPLGAFDQALAAGADLAGLFLGG
nr:PPE family protein [Mycobacterium alsense]